MNKAMLIGRLGKDPEIRATQTGTQVATLTLATSESYKDKNGDKQEKTEWHRLILWERKADLAQQYLKKGSQIFVEGKLQTREWEKDGVKRYTTEIVVRDMQFLDPKPQTGNSPYPDEPPHPVQSNSQYGGGTKEDHALRDDPDFTVDDVPF